MGDLCDAGRELRDNVDIPPTPVVELQRRFVRRQRRRGFAVAIPLVCAAAAVAIGIAVASHHNNADPVIATGPITGLSTPSGRVPCTAADLSQPGPTAMPTPQRVTSPLVLDFVPTIYPPKPGAVAVVAASQVWAKRTYLATGGGGRAQLLLGDYNAPRTVPAGAGAYSSKLVWFLYVQGVALNPDSQKGSALPGVTSPICTFSNEYLIVDATTGQLLASGEA